MNNLDGLIKAQTKLNWKTNGNFVTFKIKKITVRITEIEILTEPYFPTSFADCGEGLKIIERAKEFFEIETEQQNLKNLEEHSPVDTFTNMIEARNRESHFESKFKEPTKE